MWIHRRDFNEKHYIFFSFFLALLRCIIFHVKCCSSTERSALVWLQSMSRKIYFPISLWVLCGRTRSSVRVWEQFASDFPFLRHRKRETLIWYVCQWVSQTNKCWEGEHALGWRKREHYIEMPSKQDEWETRIAQGERETCDVGKSYVEYEETETVLCTSLA